MNAWLQRLSWLALATSPLPAQDVIVARDTAFVVHLHRGDLDAKVGKRLAAEALSVLSPLVSIAPALLGKGATAKGRPPCELHLWRHVADYEAAEQKLTGGKFRRNLAFTTWEAPQSHVVLQPVVPGAIVAATGLPQLTRRLLLHEVGHQLVYRALPNYRFHPFWLGEGAATWLEDEALRAGKAVGTALAEPHDARELGRVQALIVAGKLPTLREMVAGKALDEIDWHDAYAATAVSFRWLYERRSRAIVDTLRKIGAMPGNARLPERIADELRQAFGAEEWQKLDAAFVAWAQPQRPEWDEVFRMLDTHARPWVQIAFPDTNAIAWRSAAAPGCGVRTVVELLGEAGAQANLLLDRQAAGFVSVALRAGGGVTVLRYRKGEDPWPSFGHAEVEVVAGRRYELRATVVDGQLRIDLDGKTVVATTVDGHAFTGPWGIGVQAGAAALWHEVEELPPGE
ncbi:MAG: hypothetical protein IPK26_14605 [Planctomycetes bacterium]|nr:hypothetical protein [Planctomycetota bacterium]